jgi:hypothetical protein
MATARLRSGMLAPMLRGWVALARQLFPALSDEAAKVLSASVATHPEHVRNDVKHARDLAANFGCATMADLTHALCEVYLLLAAARS